MDIHHLPTNIMTIKIYVNNFSGWQLDAIKGFIYLRDGIDYINTNNRYKHAFSYLSKAYDKLLEVNPEDKLSLARLSFPQG